MLTPRAVLAHLASRGLLSTADILAGRVNVSEKSRRNRNFRVMTGPAKGLFVKHSRRGDNLLGREAAIYRLATGQPFARWLPAMLDYDPRRRVLVLEMLPRSGDLGNDIARQRQMTRATAEKLGRTVSSIHQCRVNGAPSAAKPWVVSLPCPSIELLREISGANLELLRIVQQSETLCRELRRLIASPRELTLIHNDLRLANCLVSRRALRVVDWELAGWGDPAWDVGCVLAEFLAVWVRSLELVPGRTAARSIASERVPLKNLQPAIRSFWVAYVVARRLTTGDAFLLRAIRFAAARLIQIAYELMDGSAHLASHGVVLLQLSENVMANPRNAATALFRIPING